MRTIQILLSVSIAVVLAFVRASYGDGEVLEEPGEPGDETTEPITGEAVTPNPGDEQPMRDPFTPYDIGGPAAAWRLEDLTAEERLVAERGVDGNSQDVQDAYADAAQGMAAAARANSAGIALRMQQLGEIGVVP
jgi:hypothetical protein